MDLFEEFFKIARQFDKMHVQYALIGGIAMAFHDEPRFTKDIDFLVLPEELEKVRKALKEIEYFESAEPWTFKSSGVTLHRFMKVDGERHMIIDILLATNERHRQIIKRCIEDEWKDGVIKIISKQDLIWMKQQRNSDQDRVDIRTLNNDED